LAARCLTLAAYGSAVTPARRSLTAVAVTLTEITGENREAVLALHVAPGQEEFVSSVRDSLAEAAEYPHARPWYRAVYASGEQAGPVGFVMLSWNAEPQPPEVIAGWFLWKLLIDERYQGRGYGAAVVRHIAELVAAEGATELLTSYVPGDGGPAGFYQRLGFVPTGELDDSGEVIVRLRLPSTPLCQHPLTSRAVRAGRMGRESGSGAGRLGGLGGGGGTCVLADQQRCIDQVDPGRLTDEVSDIHRRRPVAPELVMLVHVVQGRQRVGQDELPIARLTGGLV